MLLQWIIDTAIAVIWHSSFDTAIAWNRPFIAKEIKYFKSAEASAWFFFFTGFDILFVF